MIQFLLYFLTISAVLLGSVGAIAWSIKVSCERNSGTYIWVTCCLLASLWLSALMLASIRGYV